MIMFNRNAHKEIIKFLYTISTGIFVLTGLVSLNLNDIINTVHAANDSASANYESQYVVLALPTTSTTIGNTSIKLLVQLNLLLLLIL